MYRKEWEGITSYVAEHLRLLESFCNETYYLAEKTGSEEYHGVSKEIYQRCGGALQKIPIAHLLDNKNAMNERYYQLSNEERAAICFEAAQSKSDLLLLVSRELKLHHWLHARLNQFCDKDDKKNVSPEFIEAQQELKPVIADIARHITDGYEYFVMDGQKVTYDTYINTKAETMLINDPMTKALLDSANEYVQDYNKNWLVNFKKNIHEVYNGSNEERIDFKSAVDNLYADTKGADYKSQYAQQAEFIRNLGLGTDFYKVSAIAISEGVREAYRAAHNHVIENLSFNDIAYHENIAKRMLNPEIVGTIDRDESWVDKAVLLKYTDKETNKDAYAMAAIGMCIGGGLDYTEYKLKEVAPCDIKTAINVVQALPPEGLNTRVQLQAKPVRSEIGAYKSQQISYNSSISVGRRDGVLDDLQKLFENAKPITTEGRKKLLYEFIEKPQMIGFLEKEVESLQKAGKVKEAIEASRKLAELKNQKRIHLVKAGKEEKTHGTEIE